MPTDKPNALETAYQDALQARVRAEEAFNDLHARLGDAEARDGSLRDANRAGDESITALELLTAAAEVDRLSGLVENAQRELEEARESERVALGDKVADEIGVPFSREEVDGRIEDARERLSSAISDLKRAIADRNEACDDAGRRLQAAGAAPNARLGRISYHRMDGFNGERSRTSFNIKIDGEWLAPARMAVSSGRDQINDLVNEAVLSALRANGYTPRDGRIVPK